MSDEEGFDMSLLDPNAPAPSGPDEGAGVEEVTQEAEVVEPTELPADEPQSDPKPKTGDLMDKELQRVQQLRATLEREVEKLAKTPTEAQANRVEKAKSKLDKYLGETDVDPYSAPRDIAEEVMADRDRVERLLQENEAYRREVHERQAQLEAQNARLQFAVDYPELKGRYTEFAEKAHQALVDEIGDEVYELRPQVYTRLAGKEFMRLVKEASGSVAAPTKPAVKDTAKTPKAATILNNKSGNSIKPPEDPAVKAEALLARMGQEYFGR